MAAQKPVHLMVGALVPCSIQEARVIFEAEEEAVCIAGVAGLVQQESVADDEKELVYYADILESKKVEATLPALLKLMAPNRFLFPPHQGRRRVDSGIGIPIISWDHS